MPQKDLLVTHISCKRIPIHGQLIQRIGVWQTYDIIKTRNQNEEISHLIHVAGSSHWKRWKRKGECCSTCLRSKRFRLCAFFAVCASGNWVESKKTKEGGGEGSFLPLSSPPPPALFFFFFLFASFRANSKYGNRLFSEKKIAGYCSTKALYLNDVCKMRFFAATNTQRRKQKLNNTSRDKQITEDSVCATPRLKHFVKIQISDTSVGTLLWFHTSH